MSSLEADLAMTVGAEQVLTDPDLLDGYLWDWTRRYTGAARCVARPGSAQEVAGVLRCCADRGVPVVTQGGNTGLVGGSVPGAGAKQPAVLLSTRRLRRLDPVDTLAAQVTAGAGVTLAELRAHAAAAGLEYGVRQHPAGRRRGQHAQQASGPGCGHLPRGTSGASLADSRSALRAVILALLIGIILITSSLCCVLIT